MSDFSYNPQFIKSIERTITRERLKRYLAATGQDMPRALLIYELNVTLSENLYGILQGLEIAVRNAMHYELTVRIGSDYWFNSIPLSQHLQRKVSEAKGKAGSRPSSGKVIAELALGFWTDLTSRHTHHQFWMPYLRYAFPNTKLNRWDIHDRLQDIRHLRNRVAHHEPILTSKNCVYTGHQKTITLPEILECVEWACADTASWLKVHSRYTESQYLLARVNALNINL